MLRVVILLVYFRGMKLLSRRLKRDCGNVGEGGIMTAGSVLRRILGTGGRRRVGGKLHRS